jgi:hypothetical protein
MPGTIVQTLSSERCAQASSAAGKGSGYRLLLADLSEECYKGSGLTWNVQLSGENTAPVTIYAGQVSGLNNPLPSAIGPLPCAGTSSVKDPPCRCSTCGASVRYTSRNCRSCCWLG